MFEKYTLSKGLWIFVLLIVAFGFMSISNKANPFAGNGLNGLAAIWLDAGSNKTLIEFQEDIIEESPETIEIEITDIAICLKSKNAKLYGASWSKHTVSQKEAFGSAFVHINYIECINGIGLSNECENADILEYPTWAINGKILKGKYTLEQLANAADC